ncbi:MAG: neuromedin U, partial [Deltaproteobacteria bacterium]|nr:neuromedin U [Deltaproteobacteria bacterium]
WGIGPSFTIPTATDKELGSEKWSLGPTGVVLFQPGWGTFGGLVRQLWSVAGDDDRDDVNQTLFEPFLNYNLPKGWYLISDIIIIANWDADSDNTWTVPLGGGVGKLFKIGNQAMNARTEAYYNVEKPDNAPDWQWGFTIQFLFPK